MPTTRDPLVHLSARQTGTSDNWHAKTSAHWRQVCRDWSFQGQSIKTAELGGSPDNPFEVAFANLAHSHLRDRAANLMEYEIGFSLIEKNPDNTKAVGVFGFKVGDQWLYAPVFFLNGDLKGHELLYIKSQDMFVPLKDNWLNYLLGRKPAILGQQVGRNLSNIGVLGPNLQQLAREPYKFASASSPVLPSWARDFLPALARLVTTTKIASQLPAFLPILEAAGRQGVEFMLKVAEAYPTIYRAFVGFHGDCLPEMARKVAAAEQREKSSSIMRRMANGDSMPEDIRPADGTPDNGGMTTYGRQAWDSTTRYVPSKALGPASAYQAHVKRGSIMGRLKSAADKVDDGKPKESNTVEIFLRRDIANGGVPDYILSPEEKKKGIEQGRVVRDNRPDSAVTKIYTATTSLNLSSPDETNVYEVLVRPDKFERCLVILAPHGEGGKEDFCTIISLDSDDRWLNIHPSRVFTRSRFTRSAWNKWFDGLPDAKSLPVAERRFGGNPERCVIIGRDGQGTCPLYAYEEYDSGDGENSGGKIYSVHFDDHVHYAEGTPGFSTRPHPVWRENFDRRRLQHLRLTERAGVQFRVTSDELQIPVGFKKLVVAKPQSDEPGCGFASRSKKSPLQPGDLTDLLWSIQNSLPTLSLLSDKSEYYVNDHRMYKDSAFGYLVKKVGLREDMADHLLKTADENPNQRQSYFVKLADPYLLNSAPGGPNMPEPDMAQDAYFNTGVQQQLTNEREFPVPGMEANHADRERYKPIGPDPDTMRTAQQAAQTGQKEIFDTAMLGSLLKSVRIDSMVDRYLGDLMKGMDRLGRIYFQFLWHGEEFEKRYGKHDLPEIEDGIRNAFEANGDIVLRLQQKSIEPFADEITNDVDLSALANQ